MNNIKKQLTPHNISIIFVFFFPIALVIGPFVAELLMNTVIIIFIYSCFVKKNWTFIKTKFFKIFIIFYFYIIINSIISDYTNSILLKNFFYFRYGIFIIAILDLIKKEKFFFTKLYKFLIYTILVLTIDGYIQFFTGENILSYELSRPDRLSGFFDDELVLGSFLSKLLFVSITLFFYNEVNLKKFNIYISVPTFFLTFIIIFLSGERAAFLLTILYCGIILFSLFKFRYLLFSLLLVLVVVLIGFLDSTVKERHIDQTLVHIQPIKADGTFFDNFRYYGSMYNTANNGFKEKKIFGQGANTFRYFCNKKGLEAFNIEKINKNSIIAYSNGCNTHPHQHYLQLLAELGFIGFLYIFSIFLYFLFQLLKYNYFKIIHKKLIYKPYQIVAIINIIMIFWPITTNGNFFNNWSIMLMIMPILLANSFLKKIF